MRRLLLTVVVLLAAAGHALAAPIEYTVKLADAQRQLVHVRIHLPEGAAERDLRLPVWNALYQVRDFAQYVVSVSCRGPSGQMLAVHKLDKTTWRISGAQPGADFEYDVIAGLPGPFGAEYNQDHAFFNLAEILMYAVDARASPVRVSFTGLPNYWLIATSLTAVGPELAPGPGTFTALDYDQMVDSPVEIGAFAQAFVPEGSVNYRIVVHAATGDYDMGRLIEMVRTIVRYETGWMDDRPFNEYLFIFHFSRGPGGGGMEHANAAVIEMSADGAKYDPVTLASLTAHEFFHLWNVKRIRPQSLEPIDYTHEQYTTALWFAEGVTNTVADYILLRANLIDETRWLRYLEQEIGAYERRPAHLTQSVEDASVDTWLEKYPDYQLPQRSISYYNKGELIGVLLDLAVRDATAGQKSLRDVFRWMNRNYAQKHKFYPDTEGVRQAVEAVTGRNFKDFFSTCVTHAAPLPYNDYLKTVGLELKPRKEVAPYAGFIAVRNFDGPTVIAAVDESSEARRQGLVIGDVILLVNGKPLAGSMEDRIATMPVGASVKLRVSGRDGQHDVKLKLVGRERDKFTIVSAPTLSTDQRARRAAWLTADDQKPKDAPKGAIRAAAPAAAGPASLTPRTTR
ncbi:MAG TPA: PDZ domain-containing protein [Terriglobales bacterium]|jgi:predicted metalloprotease with PDZ domain|nr:PDZ domain-containing protein [Terriglobales bacterium]